MLAAFVVGTLLLESQSRRRKRNDVAPPCGLACALAPIIQCLPNFWPRQDSHSPPGRILATTMKHPYQCIAALDRVGTQEVSLLLAASAHNLLAIDLTTGEIRSIWSAPSSSAAPVRANSSICHTRFLLFSA